MYQCAETFLSSLHPPFCPYCDTVVLQSSLLLKNKVQKISIKGRSVLCGSRERLASGFHLKHKGVFLPDLYSFTQWVDLPLLFPSKESPDETFVPPRSSDTFMLLPPVRALEPGHRVCSGWIFFFPLFFCKTVCALRNHFSYKCEPCYYLSFFSSPAAPVLFQ